MFKINTQKAFFLVLPFILNLVVNNYLFASYILGVDEIKQEKKIIKDRLNINDFPKYPMQFSNNIYDYLTVKVLSPASSGSGVIIAQNNNIYFVLTANHVIGKLFEGDEISITTLDGEVHIAKLLQSDPNFDGALLKFSSEKTYYSAFIHPEVEPYKGMYVLTQGYALANKDAVEGSLRRSTGSVITVIENNKEGYDLFYEGTTNVGMSGGGIYTHPMQTSKYKGKGWTYSWIKNKRKDLNENMLRAYEECKESNKESCLASFVEHPCYGFSTPILVGIHGRSESYEYGGKSGASMGISIHKIIKKFGDTLISNGVFSLPKEEDTLIWKDGCPIYPIIIKNALGE